MRDLIDDLDAFRVRDRRVLETYGSYGDGGNGVFSIPFPKTGVFLRCVASTGYGWDHVSVSLPNRCPNWQEMQHIHRTFFKLHETVWEYHVPPDSHINLMPYCLHLWRKHDFDMPMPPMEFV